MRIGMLWFDGEEDRGVAARVRSAAQYYQGKYGRTPNVCFVHPSMLGGQDDSRVDGIEIKVSEAVLHGHLWMGVDDREG